MVENKVGLKNKWRCGIVYSKQTRIQVKKYYGKPWNFREKLKMALPFDPATPLLGMYLKEPETLI